MPFWLIVFVFTPQGLFTYKDEYSTAGYKECIEMAGDVMAKQFVNVINSVSMYCVSDDHYTGRRQDDDIPLGFEEYMNPMDMN